MNRFYTIKCPKCGCEYLPEEIFIPNAFFGKPKNIVKDDNGKIFSFEGDSLTTSEEYICDKCGCTFTIDCKIVFDTKVNVKHDFSEDYSTPIYKDRIILDEVNNNKLW